MKNLVLILTIWGVGAWTGLAAPQPLFLNSGLITEPIMIDATVFVNTGTIQIGQPPTGFQDAFLNPTVSYETQNTLVFTNRGTISVIPGINFEHIDEAGIRTMASDFYNGPGATVSGEFANFSYDLEIFSDPFQPLYGGFVSINATNVVNRGSLSGFYGGDIQIRGQNVDLASGKTGNGPLPFSSFRTDTYTPNSFAFTQFPIQTFLTPTDFYPETSIVDFWWRYSESTFSLEDLGFEQPFPPADPVTTNLVVDTPNFRIYTQVIDSPTDTGGPFAGLHLVNPLALVWTNQPSATNKQVEVVFVSNFDTNIIIDASWQPGRDPVNSPAFTAWVRFTTIQPDLISQRSGSTISQFVIADTWGSSSLEQLLLNTETFDSQKPTNLFAFRAFAPNYEPTRPIGSRTTNSPFYPGLFTVWYDEAFPDGMDMENKFSTNRYATWSGQLQPFPSTALNNSLIFSGNTGNTGNRPGTIFNFISTRSIPGTSLTNLAGRVAIDATNLDLRNSRIQGQSLVSIRTDNLKSSRGAVIDAPILNLDLGATNGNLVVQDLARGSVSRFGGSFAIWSTTFTNFFSVSGTNAGTATGTPIDTDDDGIDDSCDTDGDGVADVTGPCPTDGTGEVVVTNYTAIYHVTVIDNSFTTGGRSFLNDLKLRGTNVDIRDEIIVDRAFSCVGENLTISGSLDLFGQTNLAALELPILRTLTNNGILFVPGLLGPGLAPAPKLDVFANFGSATATGININSARVENTGTAATLQADGGQVQIDADEFVNSGGSIRASFDIILNAGDANLAGIAASAGGFVTLNVSGTISDGGSDFPGLIETVYGINLPEKPAAGDLPGTTVNVFAPDFTESLSFWAAENRDVSRLGYTNNASLGVLSLDAAPGGLVTFAPVGTNNAIYVERLDLSDTMLLDLESSLNLIEGFTLYYASTSTNVNPAELDGFVTPGGGTLRWVKDGSDPGIDSTVAVQMGDGRTIRVPKALRFSQTLDSDADGVVNGSDSSPFDLVVVSHVELVQTQPPAFRIEWMAAPGQTYEVQATTDLKTGHWTKVNSVLNSSNAVKRLTVMDALDPGSGIRIYRVVVQP